MPVTFIDDDLLLRSKLYYCLLFVTSYVREQKFKRILMDGGSSINIMTKSTMHDLGIIVAVSYTHLTLPTNREV